jgi:predicted Zn-dependent protease
MWVSALFLVLAACASSGVNQGDFNVVSIVEEWQLGQQLESDLARELVLVDDPIIVGYINEVGNRLVRQTEMAGLPWEFHVVRNDEINAFNIPGGHVYVHTGLIKAARNSSELVGVMAHEVGHGVARHSTEQLTRAYGLNIVAGILLGSDPAAYQQILAQILGTGAIASFSRDAEREADGLAVSYLYEAGYDPRGFVNFFEVLMEQGRAVKTSECWAHFFATTLPTPPAPIMSTRDIFRSL